MPPPDPNASGLGAANQGAGQAANGPADSPCAECDQEQTHFVRIRLIDEDEQPVADEAFEIVAPNGVHSVGLTDAKGFARVDGIPGGNCQITFPRLDREVWSKKA